MKLLLLFIEFLLGISVVIAILLHSAKGEGLGAIGSQSRLFSSQKGLESGLKKVTAILVFSFLSLALLLTIIIT